MVICRRQYYSLSEVKNDSYTRTMPIKEVGDSVGNDTSTRPSGCIGWSTLLNVTISTLAQIFGLQSSSGMFSERTRS